MNNLSFPTTKELEKNKYISLKTFKRDNSSVLTTLWFAFNDSSNKLFLTTAKKADKLKRIRNNNHVEFAFCSARGKTHSQYFAGSCRELSKNDSVKAHNLLKDKYGLLFI